MGTKGPRKMKVLVPEVVEGVMQEFKPINVLYSCIFKTKEGLLHNYRNNKNEGIKYLYNKPPKWNEQVNAFVLNFNGRVDKPSVKNFQLIEQKNGNILYLYMNQQMKQFISSSEGSIRICSIWTYNIH